MNITLDQNTAETITGVAGFLFLGFMMWRLTK